MKIVFMGTPDFAIPSLEEIIHSKHKVVLVVTAPDKERGRGKKITPTPVKEYALKNGIEVTNPVSLKDETFVNKLKEIDADLFVVVAFRILPKEVYSIPKYGSFNLHGSLLPKFRGAAPIQWALINGEKVTGVTTFFLDDKVDTGKIILKEQLEIKVDDDFGSLHDRMMVLGADAVIKTIELISANSYNLIKQEDSLASPAPKITKEICRINWDKSAEEIHNLIRGLSPYPGAYFEVNNKIYKVFKSIVINENYREIRSDWNILPDPDGKELHLVETKNEIYVKTSSGILQILDLQAEGKKRMSAEEFLRGNSISK